MRLLVTGGRTYGVNNDEQRWHMQRVLNELHAATPVVVCIHGGATGADYIAGWWARKNGVPTIAVPADWSRGRSAGPLRNQAMLDEHKPTQAVAFPGGRGTDDMVRRIVAAGIPLRDERH